VRLRPFQSGVRVIHGSLYGCLAVLEREERDAFDPVLCACVAGLLGDELVGVAAYHLDAKASRLDRMTIGVLLRGAADAGYPQVGVADDRLFQLPFGDDVGDGEPTARPQYTRRLGEYLFLVGRG
jgi:hypothetical protein